MGNLRIHFLEPNGLAVQEIVEEEESSDAVEISSEGNVGVLLFSEPSGDSRSHDEAEHNEGKEEGNKSHFEEVVIQTELVLGGLIIWHGKRSWALPRLESSLSDVSGIVPGSSEGTDGGDEEYETIEAE
jgi:hypothetical protein